MCEVNIPISSGSFLYGINVFEGMKLFRTYGHQLPLHLDGHLDRLAKSAAAVGWKLNRDQLFEDIRICCEYVTSDTYLRVIVFSETSWTDVSHYKVAILFHPVEIFKESNFECSTVNLMKGDHKTLPATIKAGANYINSRYGIVEASRGFGGFPVFVDHEGFMTETGGAALVFELNGCLCTYPSIGNTLDSITLRILKNIPSINILELPVHKTLLPLVTGCVMVGTSVDIAPITKIDNYDLSNSIEIRDHLNEHYKSYIMQAVNETH